MNAVLSLDAIASAVDPYIDGSSRKLASRDKIAGENPATEGTAKQITECPADYANADAAARAHSVWAGRPGTERARMVPGNSFPAPILWYHNGTDRLQLSRCPCRQKARAGKGHKTDVRPTQPRSRTAFRTGDRELGRERRVAPDCPQSTDWRGPVVARRLVDVPVVASKRVGSFGVAKDLEFALLAFVVTQSARHLAEARADCSLAGPISIEPTRKPFKAFTPAEVAKSWRRRRHPWR